MQDLWQEQAAEQRAKVAHSASYGTDGRNISSSGGAKEKYPNLAYLEDNLASESSSFNLKKSNQPISSAV
ncbi:MAG TPA: hypothetical protein VMF08_00675 [Candidatus Sulfotelmatobacter sp.]|nr:hypothetical protein [Candidatus Sulfotelmatobacter sp.]